MLGVGRPPVRWVDPGSSSQGHDLQGSSGRIAGSTSRRKRVLISQIREEQPHELTKLPVLGSEKPGFWAGCRAYSSCTSGGPRSHPAEEYTLSSDLQRLAFLLPILKGVSESTFRKGSRGATGHRGPDSAARLLGSNSSPVTYWQSDPHSRSSSPCAALSLVSGWSV